MQTEVIGRNMTRLDEEIRAGNGHLRLAAESLAVHAQNVELTVDALANMGVPFAFGMGKQLAGRLRDTSIEWNSVAVREQLSTFHSAFLQEGSQHRYARLDRRHAEIFANPHPWGDAVSRVFPDVTEEIQSAGIALGLELNTAAVFHLMRIAEHGLRRLASKLKVRLTDKGKPMPVDHATWGKIIDAVRVRIKKAQSLPAGPKRQAQLKEYSRAADLCEYMKDMWRNDISHTHKAYSEPESVVVLGRVKDFIQFLTTMD